MYMDYIKKGMHPFPVIPILKFYVFRLAQNCLDLISGLLKLHS